MTLWPPDDALVAEFLEDFYRNWLAGSKALIRALRETRLAWIVGSGKKSNPRYWALYVLVK
uniref:CHAT domain-containing protein n=1 Tax=Candidatus Kentrum sp. TUN TaxID=2126343 RepID=A0A450ZTD2_9GAMM|nr:MAG: CHAT domain-containing protein [Candidatus Kentron sp. TUN]